MHNLYVNFWIFWIRTEQLQNRQINDGLDERDEKAGGTENPKKLCERAEERRQASEYRVDNDASNELICLNKVGNKRGIRWDQVTSY